MISKKKILDKDNQDVKDSKIDEIISDNENDNIEFKNLNFYDFKELLIDLKKKHNGNCKNM